jgi:predicted RND superfamily exporter protein
MMALKVKHSLVLLLILFSLSPLLKNLRGSKKEQELDRDESLLPASARDVVLLTADFSQLQGDALSPDNLRIISEIDTAIRQMGGLRQYSSILTASVVRAQHDEILVVPYIPEELFHTYDPRVVVKLKADYLEFPEIWPYLSSDFSSCVFYLEPGLTYSSHLFIEQIDEIRNHMRHRYGVGIEYSGLRAIQVHIERLLAQDMLKMAPILFLLISLIYYFSFRNLKVLLVAWFLKLLATTFSYGCFRLFSGRFSPLIILVPTLNFGLLSDYFIHMFYHLHGNNGVCSWREVRSYLQIPLTLTALTSIIGFASLAFVGGDGHILLASVISLSIAVVFIFVLWWLPSESWAFRQAESSSIHSRRSFSNRISRALTVVFSRVFKMRFPVLAFCFAAGVVGSVNLSKLRVQPYPLEQFPESSTIIKAESLLNDKFSGTIPFAVEIDAVKANAFTERKNLLRLEEMLKELTLDPDVGFQHSILSVIKRMHYYFNNSDPTYLTVPDIEDGELFSSLIEQYFLFYSASASPEAYESLIDSNYTTTTIQGILKYRGTQSIDTFLDSLSKMAGGLPSDWHVTLAGPLSGLIQSKQKLERNWYLSIGAGSILIFITVLLFFKNLKMSLISLIPSFFILLVFTGVSPIFNIKINEYTIIIVAICTGLTIDYTIHILNAIKKTRNRPVMWIPTAGNRPQILKYGYSLVRAGGVPVFLSFMTSLVAFASLFLSSFSGAVHFALLLSASLGSAFFLGVFVLPLFFIPGAIIPSKILRKKRYQ